MFEFLKTFIYYPFAAISHALQGVLVGYLAARAIFKKEVSDALIALLITIAFAVYEITEEQDVHDHAYVDFETMWVTAMATGLIYTIIHLWWSFFGREPLVDITPKTRKS